MHVSPVDIVYSFAVCLNQSKEMLSTFKMIPTVNILKFAVWDCVGFDAFCFSYTTTSPTTGFKLKA